MSLEDKLVCKICGKEMTALGRHLKIHNMTSKQYYDQFLKKENEGKCLECGKETLFLNIKNGYRKLCSLNCLYKSSIVKEKKKQTCLKHFGVEHPFQSKEIKDKGKQTCLRLYNGNHQSQTKEVQEKRKQTMLNRYGVENPFKFEGVRDKLKQTCLERYKCNSFIESKKFKQIMKNKYNAENPLQSNEISKKHKQTMLDRYGVKNPLQNIEICRKQQKSAFKMKSIEIEGKKFDVQGYEEQFLRLCQKDLIPEFQIDDLTSDVPSIKYSFGDKEHIYIPDFFHQKSNTVIEIKSPWTFDRCGKFDKVKEINKAKCKGVTTTGYNFCLYILDGHGNILKKIINIKEFNND